MNERAYSRRQFLQITSTAVAAGPLLLSPSAASAETPLNRLTLGFIGMGRQNRALLNDFLKRSELQVVAVCDVDSNRREHARKLVDEFYAAKTGQPNYRSCAAYEDFQEIIARKDIDAVVIATPDHWHAVMTIRAVEAGKDVYCEKPLCQSIHEARAMVKAARRHKRIVQVGSQQRSSREFRVAVELVRNKCIGRINQIEVAVGGPPTTCDLSAEPDEPGLAWDRWLGPAPVRPYNSALSPRGIHNHYPNWRQYREYGGGGVTDWGAHHFDIAQWALDMDQSGPIAFFPPPEANAKSGARLVYANGTEVVHAAGNGITFFGTEGKLHVNRGKFELHIGSETKADSAKELDGVVAEYLGANAMHVEASNDHRGNWLDAIKSRKLPIADVEIGARTVTVCHLLNLVYQHGRPLNWDPKRERFIDGTGDPKWLDVPHRKPWSLT